MKIKSIELHGYDRFALNHYPSFIYTPQQKIQLLLGSNGCGKSSLMQELSPLPAEKSDFKAGGSKVVNIEHNGKLYTLTSSFGTTGKHSCIVHEEEPVELNQGGTAQVQKSLVAQIFGITPEIHDVMTGMERFTTMSVAKRREWFTKMSKIDFDYAVEVYQNFKNKLRSVEQILKFQQSTLLTEMAKIVDPDTRTKLQEEISQYESIIDLLIESRDTTSMGYITEPDSVLESNISSHIKEHRRLVKELAGYGFTDNPEDLVAIAHDLDHRLIAQQTKYEELGKRIEQQQSVIKTLTELGTQETGNLLADHQALLTKLKNIESGLRYFTPDTSAEEVSPAIELAYDGLFEVMQSLPSNQDRKYSKTSYQVLLDEQKETQSSIAIAKERHDKLSQIIKDFEHAKEHQQTTCPQCQHVWIRDFDENKYQAAKKELATLVVILETLSKKLEDNQSKCQAIVQYFDQYRIYLRTRDQLTALQPIWQRIENEDIVMVDPKQVLTHLQNARYDIPSLMEIKSLRHRSDEMQKLITLNEQSIETDVRKLQEQVDAELVEYSQLYASNRILHEKLESIKRKLEIHNRLKEIQISLNNLIQQKDNLANNEVQKLRHSYLQDLIRQFNIALGEHKQRINNAEAQDAIVAQLKQTIQDLTIEKESLTAMVDAMSPKDGLIAKAMSGFINHFVEQMNNIISQIWLYPFELLPINDSDDELDLSYRFVVQVKSRKIIPDIGKCSAGMQEAIDLVFRIVSMQYLGLDTAPIYLDEFGKSMDSAHRIKAFDAITKLITHSHYSQVFIVSHYEQAYGGIANTDVVVLNPDNIVIPPGTIVNRVVKFDQESLQ